MVPAEDVAAGGTHLAVMLDSRPRCAARPMLWDGAGRIVRIPGSKIRIEGARTLGQHGRQISMELRARLLRVIRQDPESINLSFPCLCRASRIPRQTAQQISGTI